MLPSEALASRQDRCPNRPIINLIARILMIIYPDDAHFKAVSGAADVMLEIGFHVW
jgi:hypothetical protein